MGCPQCLPLSVVQLKGKHCCNGFVDTFGIRLTDIMINRININKIYCKILATSSVQCHDIRGPFAYDNLAWCININKDYDNLGSTNIKKY